MTEEELGRRVDAVIAQTDDDEVAHSMEDDLHREVIEAFCPKWVQAEILRLSAADFCRWMA
jgi:hypothetical protein